MSPASAPVKVTDGIAEGMLPSGIVPLSAEPEPLEVPYKQGNLALIDHVRAAAEVGRPDQDVREPVAVEVSGRADRIAGLAAGGGARDDGALATAPVPTVARLMYRTPFVVVAWPARPGPPGTR